MNNLLAYYGMKHTPFSKNIPAGDIHLSPKALECVSRLKYTIENNETAVLFGQTGLGKSTLLRRTISELPKNQYTVIPINDTSLNPRGLYRSMLKAMGHKPIFLKNEAKAELQKVIVEQRDLLSKKTVCIIDEAQELCQETFTELRFLLNTHLDSESPVALILCGQPRLMQLLQLDNNEALFERINRFIQMDVLDRAETGRYIRAHLKYAGGGEDLFTEKAMDVVYKHSFGVPRKINQLCSTALLYGAQQKKSVLDDYDVKTLVETEMI